MKYLVDLSEENWEDIKRGLKQRGCGMSSRKDGVLAWMIAEYMPNTSPCKLNVKEISQDETRKRTT